MKCLCCVVLCCDIKGRERKRHERERERERERLENIE